MYFEKTIKSENIFEGKIIKVKRDTVELINNKTSTRELILHPGGVAVVAMDDNDNVYMVRQFRKPFEKELLEIPAGKLEYNEDHRKAGLRELKEETGLKCREFIYMGYYMSSPGFLNEIIHLYIAKGLTKEEQNLDEDEFLNVEIYHKDEILKMIKNNEITDGKSVTALLKAFNNLY